MKLAFGDGQEIWAASRGLLFARFQFKTLIKSLARKEQLVNGTKPNNDKKNEIFLKRILIFYFTDKWIYLYIFFLEVVSVPYPDQTLKTNFSNTPRQKFKVNAYSYRTNLALSEYNFTFNFCRVVIEKIVSKVQFGYGTETSLGKQAYFKVS